MVDKNYTSDDITVLSDRDHVHKRLGMYAGNTNPIAYKIPKFNENSLTIEEVTFVPAVFKTIGEILDNSIDELIQLKKKDKQLHITANPSEGIYTISDNGRGVPIDKHATGKFTPELVFGSLRAGRNFNDNQQAGVIGMNGMGASITNYCSEYFNITINRDKKEYTQQFKNCASTITKPKIVTGPARTGTEISFKLQPSVFKHGVTIPEDLIRNRAMEIAFNNPEITVVYNKEKFSYKKGLLELISKISDQYFCFENDGMKFYIVFDQNKNIDEQIFTWVNSSLLFDGGICNTQFLNAFTEKVIESLTPQAKKQKCDVTRNDIRQNLLILATLEIERPEYDAQSKTRLTGPNLKKNFVEIIETQWKSFQRNNRAWLDQVLERAAKRHQVSSDKDAVKKITQPAHKKIPGLIDATNKYRHECILAVTEGLSASSMISEVRDPKILASFPLTGKINNVYDCKASTLLGMPKVIHLIQAIGLVPGQKAVRANLNYGQVWISTDADPDGDDICSLLTNLFYQFWPELFDPSKDAFIKRLVAPNVVVYKDNERVLFANRTLYEKNKSKYKGWTAEYYKGLGSMSVLDWQKILYDTNYQIPIIDTDGKLKETLKLLFDKDLADERKTWLNTEG